MIRIRGAGLLVEYLADTRQHPALLIRRKRIGNYPYTFQCGKHVAHLQNAAIATTAGLEIVSGTGGLCDSARLSLQNKLWASSFGGLRVFRRIVKKRTKPQGSNRPERRVPDSDGDRRGLSHWRRWLTSPLLGFSLKPLLERKENERS